MDALEERMGVGVAENGAAVVEEGFPKLIGGGGEDEILAMNQERRKDTGGFGSRLGFLEDIKVIVGVGEVTNGRGDEVEVPEGRGLDRASALTHDVGEYGEVIGKRDAVAQVMIGVTLEKVEGGDIVRGECVNQAGHGSGDVRDEGDILAELDRGVGAKGRAKAFGPRTAIAHALFVEVAAIGEISDAAIGQGGEGFPRMDGVLEEGLGRRE
jgi:hypothetical protein